MSILVRFLLIAFSFSGSAYGLQGSWVSQIKALDNLIKKNSGRDYASIKRCSELRTLKQSVIERLFIVKKRSKKSGKIANSLKVYR